MKRLNPGSTWSGTNRVVFEYKSRWSGTKGREKSIPTKLDFYTTDSRSARPVLDHYPNCWCSGFLHEYFWHVKNYRERSKSDADQGRLTPNTLAERARPGQNSLIGIDRVDLIGSGNVAKPFIKPRHSKISIDLNRLYVYQWRRFRVASGGGGDDGIGHLHVATLLASCLENFPIFPF